MTTFYICRHGETENNKNGRLSGWIDTPLTPAGFQNAAASATILKGLSFNRVISSDLGRAFITAYSISREIGYHDRIEPMSGLREVNYGDYANRLITEVIAEEANIDFENPSGETLAQMQQRVMACLETISQNYPDQTILLVAHDGTINAIYSSFVEQEISSVGKSRTNAHDFIGKFTYDNGNVISFEDLKHE